MILDTIANSAAIEALHPLFSQLFDFVRTHDLTAMPPGRITIAGDDLYINLSDATLVPREAQKLEVHRAYIDVHFPLTADETMGWTPLCGLTSASEKPFDLEADFALYAEPAATYFTVRPGEFCVMLPNDAHAPLIGSGPLRKAVAKVRIR